MDADDRATRHLREGVRRAYSSAAASPRDEHPFPMGRQFAESLGYARDLLDALPAASADAFSGVSNVAAYAHLPADARILDLGCGAGLDSLVAARRAGPAASVVGVDFSGAMLARARRAASAVGAHNVTFGLADAERLPLEGESTDVALANGIFNLNPARDAIFSELARVVRPGGVVYAAELILREALSSADLASETDWFA